MASVYSEVVGLMDKVLGGVQNNIFSYSQMIWQSALSQVLLVISACVFVYLKIAGGNEWNRNDFKQIGTWLITYTFLTAIFASYDNYAGFIGILEIPIEYLYQGIKNGGGKTLDLNGGVDNAIYFLGQIFEGYNFDIHNPGKSIMKLIIGTLAVFILIIFIIFLIIFTIIIKFMSSIILSLCPLFIPCLIIKQFRGYFFSWLKLYASIALQAPFIFLIGGVIFNGVTSFTNKDFSMDKSTTEVCASLLTPIIITLIGIAALAKIPTWTQQIIGSGDGGNSTGLKAMAEIGGRGMGKAIEGKVGGASFGRSAIAGMVAMIPGGESIANKILNPKKEKEKEESKDNENSKTSEDGKMEASPTPHKK